MENKTTTELLDLLQKFEKKAAKKGEYNWDEYGEIFAELRKREPFRTIIGNENNGDPSLEERIEGLESDIKLLKRHKHDEHSGDVLIRI